jgi:aryl-alcohol dehydrogenase-like predicted oxidoreductase
MPQVVNLAGRLTLPSLNHFRENLKAATLQIPAEVLADLDAVSRQDAAVPI